MHCYYLQPPKENQFTFLVLATAQTGVTEKDLPGYQYRIKLTRRSSGQQNATRFVPFASLRLSA
jgi:hypothetical protein